MWRGQHWVPIDLSDMWIKIDQFNIADKFIGLNGFPLLQFIGSPILCCLDVWSVRWGWPRTREVGRRKRKKVDIDLNLVSFSPPDCSRRSWKSFFSRNDVTIAFWHSLRKDWSLLPVLISLNSFPLLQFIGSPIHCLLDVWSVRWEWPRKREVERRKRKEEKGIYR